MCFKILRFVWYFSGCSAARMYQFIANNQLCLTCGERKFAEPPKTLKLLLENNRKSKIEKENKTKLKKK